MKIIIVEVSGLLYFLYLTYLLKNLIIFLLLLKTFPRTAFELLLINESMPAALAVMPVALLSRELPSQTLFVLEAALT